MIDRRVVRRELIEGRPALLAVDMQGPCDQPTGREQSIPLMDDYARRTRGAVALIQRARTCGVPVIVLREAHRRNRVDFGRELDGAEDIYCLEGDELTALDAEFLELCSDDYVITKRRYSCFFGTDLEILLRGPEVDTLIFVGSLTDVRIHYTFVDAHQRDCFCRVAEDCVCGSDRSAHEAALNAMEYLQCGAHRSSEEIAQAFAAISAGPAAARRRRSG